MEQLALAGADDDLLGDLNPAQREAATHHDGPLLVVSSKEARLLRKESDGSLVTHADLSSISDRGWNEVVVDGPG